MQTQSFHQAGRRAGRSSGAGRAQPPLRAVGGRAHPRAAGVRTRAALAAPPPVPAPPASAEATPPPAAGWAPGSWRDKVALQQPAYPDRGAVAAACEELAAYPPLIFAGEARTLQSRLAAAARGEAFVLQGGDCAEAFRQFGADRIRDTYRVLLQMSAVLMFGGGVPVVKIGRMAGQFAKPRSADAEERGGASLPSYRGDIINGPEFTPEARLPDPTRMVRAYNQSAATLNLLRGFSTGGYAGLARVRQWNLDFMANSEEGRAYMDLAARVDEAITFMQACGLDAGQPIMRETEFYTSHEALLLDYEEALTRRDSTTGAHFGCSAHMLWVGERTRQLGGAHVEFMRGLGNPVGVKVSDKMPPAELAALAAALNPRNVEGRLSVIVRMGAAKLRERLPALIEAVEEAGQTVTWVCDPMHGNTESVNGFKTRRYDNVRAEVEAFFDVHEAMGSVPGGIHLEMTGDDVTECIGGGASITPEDLDSRYHTHCDPRLNAEQSLEIAFACASRLRQRRERLEREKPKRQAKPSLAF